MSRAESQADQSSHAVRTQRGRAARRGVWLAVALIAGNGCHGWPPHRSGATTATTREGVAIAAWDPPGGVLTTVHAADPAGGGLVPVRPVTLPPTAATLRAGLQAAYHLDRLPAGGHGTEPAMLVVLRRDSSDELLPLPLVLRYDLGDWPLQAGDVIGLWAGSADDWVRPAAGESFARESPLCVQVQGWVARPGRYQLADPALTELVGDPELPAGEFLKQPSGAPWADLLVVQRTTPAGVKRIYLPNELAAAAYPLEDERFWEAFAGIALQNGDTIAAVPSSLVLNR